jgi:hypothetical protein
MSPGCSERVTTNKILFDHIRCLRDAQGQGLILSANQRIAASTFVARALPGPLCQSIAASDTVLGSLSISAVGFGRRNPEFRVYRILMTVD